MEGARDISWSETPFGCLAIIDQIVVMIRMVDDRYRVSVNAVDLWGSRPSLDEAKRDGIEHARQLAVQHAAARAAMATYLAKLPSAPS